MAVHFHTLKVKAVNKETPDCVSIVFVVPENLQQEFLFEQGQNITLKKNIAGEEVRRSYSICAAPFENELKVAVKKVPDGKFSGYAIATFVEKSVTVGQAYGQINDLIGEVGHGLLHLKVGTFDASCFDEANYG